MKTYLTLLFSLVLIYNTNGQYSSKSTFAFNTISGLSYTDKDILEDVYVTMNDENYHCFSLLSSAEISKYPNNKLTALARQRAKVIQDYYYKEQGVDIDNVFIKYGGSYPKLWLHKPSGHLTASGEINLDEKYKQCYSYNSSQGKTIYTDNGNKLYFPVYAFEKLDGVAVKNNNVSICLWEFADKKSLIYSNLTTDSKGKMLETAGSFYIEANLNGERLKLRDGEQFTADITATEQHNDMFTYYGYQKDGIIDWEVDKNEPVLVNNDAIPTEMTEEVYYEDEYGDILVAETDGVIDGVYYQNEGDEMFYQLSAGKLGWINCDRFYDVQNTSTLAVKVDTKEPVVVRLVFRDIESVMPCYANSNHKNKYEASGIPTGEKVLLLAYSVKDNNAVLGYKEVTIGENSIEEVVLNNLSKTRFESAVRELLY